MQLKSFFISNRHTTFLLVINYILITYKGLTKNILDTSVLLFKNNALWLMFFQSFHFSNTELIINPQKIVLPFLFLTSFPI